MSEFGTLDLEGVQEEEKRLKTKGQGGFLDQFVPMPEIKPGEVGTIELRILPPSKGGKLFQYNRIHSINGRKIHCPRPLVNGKWDKDVPCPICDYYNSLWRQIDKLEDAGDTEEAERLKKEARSIKPIERYYYNAIVRKLTVNGEQQLNVGPRVLSVGKTVHQMIIRAIVSDRPEEKLGDITNIKTGFDFIMKKELRSGYPNYDRSVFAREASPLGDQALIDHVAENMHDLTKFRTIKPMEELKKELAIHRGLIPDESDSFDVDKSDAEYQGPSSTTATSASVPADVTAEATATEAPVETATAEATSTPASDVVTDDITVESEEFLETLQEMEEELES